MKHRPPRNFDREASEADRVYQLAREEEVMNDYEQRQREIAEILDGRRPGVSQTLMWVVIGLWAISMGGAAWAVTRWLWS